MEKVFLFIIIFVYVKFITDALPSFSLPECLNLYQILYFLTKNQKSYSRKVTRALSSSGPSSYVSPGSSSVSV